MDCGVMAKNEELRNTRKQKFAEMEQKLKEIYPREDDRMFYYHPSEDRIVLSHALFWVLSGTLKGKIRQEKSLLLLRQYEEEMLDAYLTDDEDFPDLLRYCNILYEYMPVVINASHDIKNDKDARKLAAVAVVAGGYGGDMPEALAYELLDDMDFVHNKVKCRRIEEKLPQLMEMVDMEVKR